MGIRVSYFSFLLNLSNSAETEISDYFWSEAFFFCSSPRISRSFLHTKQKFQIIFGQKHFFFVLLPAFLALSCILTHFTSFYFTPLTSLHFTSLHFTSLHFHYNFRAPSQCTVLYWSTSHFQREQYQ